MNYEVKLGNRFKKNFKRLWKKYRSLDIDLEELINELKQSPYQGADLGNGVRKIRMAIRDKGKGKSHGARVITYTAILSINEGVVTLLSIYDKAEQSTITQVEINRLLEELGINLSQS